MLAAFMGSALTPQLCDLGQETTALLSLHSSAHTAVMGVDRLDSWGVLMVASAATVI